jgi:hypothetical protein
VVQVRHQDQVLLAGEQAVHRRELTGDSDRGADRIGLPSQIVAGDGRLTAVGADQRGQNLHRGGLPAPLGPSNEETVPFRTSRSMPSSTTWSPNDLRNPVATIADGDGMVATSLLSQLSLGR